MTKIKEKHYDAIDSCEKEEIEHSAIYYVDKEEAATKCSKISIEYAIEILNKVLKKYKIENADAVFKGTKFISYDEIVLNEIKELIKNNE
jgi:hypothetical protein